MRSVRFIRFRQFSQWQCQFSQCSCTHIGNGIDKSITNEIVHIVTCMNHSGFRMWIWHDRRYKMQRSQSIGSIKFPFISASWFFHFNCCCYFVVFTFNYADIRDGIFLLALPWCVRNVSAYVKCLPQPKWSPEKWLNRSAGDKVTLMKKVCKRQSVSVDTHRNIIWNTQRRTFQIIITIHINNMAASQSPPLTMKGEDQRRDAFKTPNVKNGNIFQC